jgi:hypothetical protein
MIDGLHILIQNRKKKTSAIALSDAGKGLGGKTMGVI